MKKKIIVVVISIIILISSTFTIYAYFNNLLFKQDQKFEYNSSSASIEINSEEEFYNHIDDYYLNKNYNSTDYITDSDNRKNLILINDIQINNDTYITSNINLNLNGKTLILNGNRLIFNHIYSGQIIIYNGTISSDEQSTIIVDTPNALLIQKDLVLTNVTLEYLNVNNDLVLNNALMYAVYNLQKYNSNLLDKLYTNTSCSLPSYHCDFEHSNPETTNNCIYTYDDLDFRDTFFNYDITYEYIVENTDILSPKGNVLATGNTVLTIKVNNTKQIMLNIHVISKDDSEAMSKAAVLSFMHTLADYQVNSEGVLAYEITGAIMISSYDSYFEKDLVFSISNIGKEEITNSSSSSTYFEQVSTTKELVMNITSEVAYLSVTASGYTLQDIPLTGKSGATIIDNNTYALQIVRANYNDEIIITGKVNTDNVKEYSFKELCTNENYFIKLGLASNALGVDSISYSLINNVDGVYSIDTINNRLIVVNEPTAQTVFLQVTISFDSIINHYEPKQVTISVPIRYSDSVNEEEPSISSFRPYYLYFNREILARTNGYTYNDFEIPFSYGSSFPIYGLDISIKDLNGNDVNNNFVSISVEYAGQTYTIDNLKEFTTSNPTDLNLLRAMVSNSLKWNVTINENNIPINDSIVTFSYIYNMNDGNEWQTSSDLTTVITIPGIVRCGTNERVKNQTLYERIFEIYHSDETYVNGQTFIITSRLSREVAELDFSNNTLIDDFAGIELLTGVKSLNMRNAGISGYNVNKFGTLATYISSMQALEVLDLSNNSIKDRDARSDNFPFPTGTNNEFVSKISVLKNLKMLYLNDNKLYSFAGLSNFESLEKAYVHNNSFTSTFFWGDIANAITAIINSIYGSKGTANEADFAIITANGTKVIVEMQGQNEIEYVSSDSGEYTVLIRNLMNLEYQDKLKDGLDISAIWSTLSVTPSTYTSKTFSNSINNTIGTDSVSFEAIVDDVNGITVNNTTKFKIVYTYEIVYDEGLFQDVKKQAVTIEIEHEITRY